ncbi:MAG: hypothetical protein ACYTGH_03890 [Planctomycetota bacterium]
MKAAGTGDLLHPPPGVLELIAGLLLPALDQAMAQARLTTCKSNERQLYLAYTYYFNDYATHLPPANGQRANYLCIANNGFLPMNLGTFYLVNYLTDPALVYCTDHAFNTTQWHLPDSPASLSAMGSTGAGVNPALSTYVARGPEPDASSGRISSFFNPGTPPTPRPSARPGQSTQTIRMNSVSSGDLRPLRQVLRHAQQDTQEPKDATVALVWSDGSFGS